MFPDLRLGAKPAVIMAGSGRTLTYAELVDRAHRLARVWHERGLRRGDHVAMLMVNEPEVFEVYWAAVCSGLYVTAVSTHLSHGEAAYIVDDCEARCLVVSGSLADLAAGVAETTSGVTMRFASGGSLPGHEDYEEVLASSSSAPLSDRPQGLDMLYSSGTTGRPKGIRVCCTFG